LKSSQVVNPAFWASWAIFLRQSQERGEFQAKALALTVPAPLEWKAGN
jgi:hypothetical protein